MNPDMEQPYRPPRSSVVAPKEPGELKRTSVLIAIILNFITGGLYAPYWYLTRREPLKALNDAEEIPRWAGILLFLWSLGVLVIQVVIGGAPLSESAAMLWSIYQIAGAVLTLFLAFRTKSILEGIYDMRVSGIWTFFFQFLYLQYKINQAEQGVAEPATMGLNLSPR